METPLYIYIYVYVYIIYIQTYCFLNVSFWGIPFFGLNPMVWTNIWSTNLGHNLDMCCIELSNNWLVIVETQRVPSISSINGTFCRGSSRVLKISNHQLKLGACFLAKMMINHEILTVHILRQHHFWTMPTAPEYLQINLSFSSETPQDFRGASWISSHLNFGEMIGWSSQRTSHLQD